MLAKLSGKFCRCCSLRLPIGALALGLLVLASPNLASAADFKTIYSFCVEENCKGGVHPRFGPLLAGPDGVLYGTTEEGGKRHRGNVFALVPQENGTWQEVSLFSFCGAPCGGGAYPEGGVIRDVAGNLYGVAPVGGAHHGGIVYELSPPAAGRNKWTGRVLYNFCAELECADGKGPIAQLTYAGAQTGIPYDGVSPLYGTTRGGGRRTWPHRGGVLFSLTPAEGTWTENVLHAFCSEQNCTDGQSPAGTLLADSDGGLYGVTIAGGEVEDHDGTVYQFKNQTYQVLYRFCTAPDCSDGAQPSGGLTMDAQGNLFGTTYSGGAPQGGGTIYEVSFPGGQPQHTVLYRFCAQTNCTDGSGPTSQLALDSEGHLFGTTAYGGNDGGGTVFVWDGTSLSDLYSFCIGGGPCWDGSTPEAGPVLDGMGHLFGTTSYGGTGTCGTRPGCGTVYELTLQNKKPRGR